MSTQVLVLNRENSKWEENSRLVYKFPQPADFQDTEYEVTLGFASVPFSWRNITAARGNNTFTYTWYVNGVPTDTLITLPDGYYTVDFVNQFIESQLVAAKRYYIDADGKNVYPIRLASNATYYKLQFELSSQVKDAVELASLGYTLPAGVTTENYDPTGRSPIVKIQTEGFSKWSGFSIQDIGGIVNPVNPAYYLGDLQFPTVDPVSSVNITTNLIENTLQLNKNLTTFIPTVSYGEYIKIEPVNSYWQDVTKYTYDRVTIQFEDQAGDLLKVLDNDIVVLLLIREKKLS